ncbi:MAG: AtzG-like protein [Betaproteobacteria bacterium]
MITPGALLGAAQLGGLEVPPERMPAVQGNLERLAQVAALLEAVALAPEDEIGPEWKP